MDSPNHGHSAALNDQALLKHPDGICMYYLHAITTRVDNRLQPVTAGVVAFKLSSDQGWSTALNSLVSVTLLVPVYRKFSLVSIATR